MLQEAAACRRFPVRLVLLFLAVIAAGLLSGAGERWAGTKAAEGEKTVGSPNLQVDFPLYPDFSFSDYVFRTNRTEIEVTGRTAPEVKVTVNGVFTVSGADGRFSVLVPLPIEGPTFLRVQAQDADGDTTTLIVPIIRDTTPPELTIPSPPSGWQTREDSLELQGKTEPGARVWVDGESLAVSEDGSFAVTKSLQPGSNFFAFTAADEAGNLTRVEVVAILDREPPSLTITSPEPGLITNQSEVLVAGQTEAGAVVAVDGQEVPVDAEGRFQHTVALTADGTRYINVRASDAAGNQIETTLRVVRDTRAPSITPQEPAAPVALLPGDVLVVRFRGEAGATASFDIGDRRIGIPAAEGNPGNYTGIYRIQPDDRFENAPIRLRLKDKAGNEGSRYAQSVTVLDPMVPLVVQVTASDYAVLRTGPGTDYERLTNVYAPTRMEVRGKAGEWFKVQLGTAQTAWVHESVVTLLPPGSLPPRALISQIRTNPQPDGSSQVSIYLSERVPFLIYPDVRRRSLRVTLYNAVYGLYHMAYGPGEKLIKLMTLNQPAGETSELIIDIDAPHVSGYFARYQGNTLVIEVRPPLPRSLEGVRITLDPGHGGESGAVGQQGLREADVNLDIALRLERLLQEAGAKVIMTRRTDNRVSTTTDDLYARVEIAETSRSQLFISIHNNAVGGSAAMTVEGTETYYYNPLSGQLARIAQEEMVAVLSSTDRFFAYRSFAVIRQTGMPAILVEGNFISNPEIERWMREGDFTERMAQALFRAIVRFLEEVGVGPTEPEVTPSLPDPTDPTPAS
ncbi:MAG: N-acetylmuramoyl-L-alanine amidase [Limnochordales bacterium]|nr:N-acetylmuramoyl-L-alanine amidase [Limnochordales bacterium]